MFLVVFRSGNNVALLVFKSIHYIVMMIFHHFPYDFPVGFPQIFRPPKKTQYIFQISCFWYFRGRRFHWCNLFTKPLTTSFSYLSIFFQFLVIFHLFFYKKIDQYGYDAPTNHDVLLIILCLNRLFFNTKLIFWCISEKFYSICHKIYNNSYFYQKRHSKTSQVRWKNCINVYIFLTFLVNLGSIFLKIIDLFSNFLKKLSICINFIICKKNS